MVGHIGSAISHGAPGRIGGGPDLLLPDDVLDLQRGVVGDQEVGHAITQRDLIVVEGVVMLLVATVVVVNLLVDLAYAVVDPRLRVRT